MRHLAGAAPDYRDGGVGSSVFFAIVAVIQEQHLLGPKFDSLRALPRELQPSAVYAVNGVLSSVTENVFIATVFYQRAD